MDRRLCAWTGSERLIAGYSGSEVVWRFTMIQNKQESMASVDYDEECHYRPTGCDWWLLGGLVILLSLFAGTIWVFGIIIAAFRK